MSETMNRDDAEIARHCRRAMPSGIDAPAFDGAFAAAERRYRMMRRRQARFGVAAAIGTLAVSAFFVLDRDAQVPQGDYIEISELMDSTRWTAPSDVLLPEREIDVYRDLPSIPASTNEAPGALL